MKRFLFGLLLGSVAPVAAQEVITDCRPIAVPKLDCTKIMQKMQRLECKSA